MENKIITMNNSLAEEYPDIFLSGLKIQITEPIYKKVINEVEPKVVYYKDNSLKFDINEVYKEKVKTYDAEELLEEQRQLELDSLAIYEFNKEHWVDIPNSSYQISNKYNVRNLKSGRLLATQESTYVRLKIAKEYVNIKVNELYEKTVNGTL